MEAHPTITLKRVSARKPAIIFFSPLGPSGGICQDSSSNLFEEAYRTFALSPLGPGGGVCQGRPSNSFEEAYRTLALSPLGPSGGVCQGTYNLFHKTLFKDHSLWGHG